MTSPVRFRVMVVDDHPVVREGVRYVLETSGHFKVVVEASDGEEAVAKAASQKPDVIVMDVFMPCKDGIEACRDIMELLPETRVIMLTVSTEEDALIGAIAAGAAGYLQKDSTPEELVATVVDVAKGRLRIPDQVVKELFDLIRGRKDTPSRQSHGRLTALEQETLTLFASGMSYVQIAEARSNSVVTIRNTIYRIQNKLGINTKQELVVWAVRNGLLDNFTPGDHAPSTP